MLKQSNTIELKSVFERLNGQTLLVMEQFGAHKTDKTVKDAIVFCNNGKCGEEIVLIDGENESEINYPLENMDIIYIDEDRCENEENKEESKTILHICFTVYGFLEIDIYNLISI